MGGSRSKELFDAARAGDEGGVEAALENGATVDEADDDGETPLFIAALNGHDAVAG